MPNMNDTLAVDEDVTVGTEYRCVRCWSLFIVPEGEDPTMAMEGAICPDCSEYVYECGRCGVSIVSVVDVAGWEVWCDTCVCGWAVYCEDCGTYEPLDDHCESRADLLHDYGYKPYPEFHGTDPHNLFLGLEWELDGAEWSGIESGVEFVGKHLGTLAYCKEDGSLESGMEIVTHPMSHEYMRGVKWDQLARDLRRTGLGPHDEAGVHVHVSRAGFASKSHMYKFTQFFYRNQSFCEAIANRSSQYYCQYSPEIQRDNAAAIKGERYSMERMSAVNLRNGRTIEVRIFRSTLTPGTLRSYMDFVHALVEYTRGMTVADVRNGALTGEAFATWVRTEHKDTYPDLAERRPVRAAFALAND